MYFIYLVLSILLRYHLHKTKLFLVYGLMNFDKDMSISIYLYNHYQIKIQNISITPKSSLVPLCSQYIPSISGPGNH